MTTRSTCTRCGLPQATDLQDYLDNSSPNDELCGDHLSGSPVAWTDCRDRALARQAARIAELESALAEARGEVERRGERLRQLRTGILIQRRGAIDSNSEHDLRGAELLLSFDSVTPTEAELNMSFSELCAVHALAAGKGPT